MKIKLLIAIISLLITGGVYLYLSVEKTEQHLSKLIEINSIERHPGRIEPMPNVLVVERYQFDHWDDDIFSSLENRIKIHCKNIEDCLPKIDKAISPKID